MSPECPDNSALPPATAQKEAVDRSVVKFGLKTHGVLSAKSVRHGIVEWAGITGCNAPRLVFNADLVSAKPIWHQVDDLVVLGVLNSMVDGGV